MNQNLITDLICIDCGANLMADLAEDGALFDTARGNDGTNASVPFTTNAVNVVLRPPASVAAGSAYSYQSGLVLRGGDIGAKRARVKRACGRDIGHGDGDMVQTSYHFGLQFWPYRGAGMARARGRMVAGCPCGLT
jgi:hypothetical protein